MIETALVIGPWAVITPLLIWMVLTLSKVKSKVDIMYENLNIRFKFKDNGKG